MDERQENSTLLSLISYEIGRQIKTRQDDGLGYAQHTFVVEAELAGRKVKIEADMPTMIVLRSVLFEAALKG